MRKLANAKFSPLRSIGLLVIASACLGSLGCGGSSPAGAVEGSAPGGLRVVATTGPVGDAVRRVGGDRIDLAVLMGPGIDPHLYKELPSDLKRLEAAEVVFYNGLHLEGRMGDVLERLAERKTVVALADWLAESKDARLITHEGSGGLPDPHVWHDVALWSECVARVAEGLTERDPEGAATYRANAETLRAELATLDAEARAALAQVPKDRRVLVTAHDAFAYFSRAYGLDSLGLKGVSTEDEVDLGRLEEVVATLVERKVPAVFVETAVAPRVVRALVEPCAARGHTVRIGGELYADALGPQGSGAEDYAGMIRANVETITTALSAGTEQEGSTNDALNPPPSARGGGARGGGFEAGTRDGGGGGG
ncbi:MAG: metal ABC transporter solute-binding protein, Zn/Mn family, partial [Lacipirellulaceae bacterium]